MRIRKTTLERLANRGIKVNTYACTDDEYTKQMYRHYHDYLRTWYAESDYVTDDEKAYRKTQECKDEWERKTWEYVDKDINSNPESLRGRWYDADTLYIFVDDILIKRNINGKSKEVTEDFVIKAIEKEKKTYQGIYGEFAKNVQKLFVSKFGNNNGWIYPTTYGIGVWIFFNFKADECTEKVRQVLDSLHIEYENEFSEHGFVYRFKISKKEVNRRKLIA